MKTKSIMSAFIKVCFYRINVKLTVQALIHLQRAMNNQAILCLTRLIWMGDLKKKEKKERNLHIIA